MLTKSLISAPMGNNNSKNSKPQKQNEDNFEDFDSQISKFSRQQSSTGQDSPRLSTKQGSKVSAKQSAKESPRLSKVSASVEPVKSTREVMGEAASLRRLRPGIMRSLHFVCSSAAPAVPHQNQSLCPSLLISTRE